MLYTTRRLAENSLSAPLQREPADCLCDKQALSGVRTLCVMIEKAVKLACCIVPPGWRNDARALDDTSV
jgi:hypothetical protein